MSSNNIQLPPLERINQCLEVSTESPSGLVWKYREELPPGMNKRFAGKRAGCVRISDGYGYWVVRIEDRLYRAHRIIYALIHGKDPLDRLVDHIDGNGLNNVEGNLRIATHVQNSCNSKKPSSNTKGFKGVFPRKDRWRAKVTFKGKPYLFGSHATPEEAHAAYVVGSKQLHGEFHHPG